MISSQNIGRREFLGWTAAAFVASHHRLVDGVSPPLATRMTRILELELLSGVPLSRLREFYCGRLGLPAAHDTPDRLTIAAGDSRVTFVPSGQDAGLPFYHFAFNIPENKIVEALHWQEERSAMLPIPPRNRAAGYPDAVVDYSHWNAHSIFFLDPAGNVVEYIARHDLANASRGPFSSRDILCASEIAFVVDDVRAAAAAVRPVAAVEQYRGGDENFMALGDEHGLLLVMKRGRILNFDRDSDEKAARVFRTSAVISGPRAADYSWPGVPYTIRIA